MSTVDHQHVHTFLDESIDPLVIVDAYRSPYS